MARPIGAGASYASGNTSASSVNLSGAGRHVVKTDTLSLTAGLNDRYGNDPGAGLKNGDTLFVTGISVKLD